MDYILVLVITYLFIKYIEPILDVLLEVFTYRNSERITEHQLNAQAMTMEFIRAYPESTQDMSQELQPLIGFQIDGNLEDCDDEEDY